MNGPTIHKNKGTDRARPLHNDNWRNVPHTTTAGGDKRHLTGICYSYHSSTVGVIRHDHVPWKLIWTERRSNHQSDSDTRPVPNYPRWLPRKRAPSLDKWTFFPGINTNSLTPTGASPHLIPKTQFSTIFLTFIPLCSLLFTETDHIYSHSFSTFIASLLTLSSKPIWQVPHRYHPPFS